MPVQRFTEEDQLQIIQERNNKFKKFDHIPLVERNYDSGWPLIQVSLFSINPNADTLKYLPVVGGGKCHGFFPGAFSLAGLLTKLPGTIEVTSGYGQKKNKESLTAGNVGLFLDGFAVTHKQAGIKISSESGAYGKTLEITLPEGDNEKLVNAFFDDFKFALQPESQRRISNFGAYKELHDGYTPQELSKAVDKEVAVFSNGQIFIDFGAFLEKAVKDQALTEYFKGVFRVDEFLKLKQQNENFRPKIENTSIEQLEYELELKKADFIKNNPSIQNLYQKIEVMRRYGENLEDKDKGMVAKTLADKLKHKVDIFVQNSAQTNPESKEINQFKMQFIDLLHSQDKAMSTHRKIWKPIVANILIALSGVGLIALAIKAGSNALHSIRNHKSFKFNDSCFFAKTRREEQLHEIESALSFVKS